MIKKEKEESKKNKGSKKKRMKEAMKENVQEKRKKKKEGEKNIKNKKEMRRERRKKTTQSWGKSGEGSGGAVRVSHDRRTQHVSIRRVRRNIDRVDACTGGTIKYLIFMRENKYFQCQPSQVP